MTVFQKCCLVALENKIFFLKQTAVCKVQSETPTHKVNKLFFCALKNRVEAHICHFPGGRKEMRILRSTLLAGVKFLNLTQSEFRFVIL